MTAKTMKIFLILFCIAVIPSHSQQLKASLSELQQDFEIFIGSLKDFHPGPYWYRTPKEINQCFDSIQATLTTPMTDNAFI